MELSLHALSITTRYCFFDSPDFTGRTATAATRNRTCAIHFQCFVSQSVSVTFSIWRPLSQRS